jgi:hypothetical protein
LARFNTLASLTQCEHSGGTPLLAQGTRSVARLLLLQERERALTFATAQGTLSLAQGAHFFSETIGFGCQQLLS